MPNCPDPTASGGGSGIGEVPIPSALDVCASGGGSGIGEVPIPATLRRNETLLSTTNNASKKAIK